MSERTLTGDKRRWCPCDWCLTRGHVVVECLKCKGMGGWWNANLTGDT